MQLPFNCYHCNKRFLLKPSLKEHEIIHRGERLIKTMKHPLFMKPLKKYPIMDLEEKMEKVAPFIELPFLMRSLQNTKSKLRRAKGR